MQIRVLSIPGRRHENRYFPLLLDALGAEGVDVVPATPARAATFSYDVLHLNFPTHYVSENGVTKATLAWLGLAAYLICARLLGRRLVYTVHDVVPLRVRHPRLQASFIRLVHRLTGAFIFLSQSLRDYFTRIYPQDRLKPWLVTPHGPYPTVAITERERREARQAIIGTDGAFLIGFLGNIKPYKNILALRQVPARLADGRPVHILVAGSVERGHADAVDAVLESMPAGTVTRQDKHLSDEELDSLIQTVDAVLLPYTRGSNSGVAMLVLSNGGRLIGSSLPIFEELARSVGVPWAYSIPSETGADQTGRIVEKAASDGIADADIAALRSFLDDTSYSGAAAKVAALYRDILGTRAQARAIRLAPR